MFLESLVTEILGEVHLRYGVVSCTWQKHCYLCYSHSQPYLMDFKNSIPQANGSQNYDSNRNMK